MVQSMFRVGSCKSSEQRQMWYQLYTSVDSLILLPVIQRHVTSAVYLGPGGDAGPVQTNVAMWVIFLCSS